MGPPTLPCFAAWAAAGTGIAGAGLGMAPALALQPKRERKREKQGVRVWHGGPANTECGPSARVM